MENILQYLLFPVLVGDTSLTDAVERRLLWRYRLIPQRIYTDRHPLLCRLIRPHRRRTVCGLSGTRQVQTILDVVAGADGRLPVLFCDRDFWRRVSLSDRARLESVFLIFGEETCADLFCYLDRVKRYEQPL